VSAASLIPTITYKGKSITPDNGTAQNFTNPVSYVVTAEDGSTKTYVVIINLQSSAKSITSFVFKASDNAGFLTSDENGDVETDTIKISLPSGTPLNNLIPSIVFAGKKIVPSSGTAQDFTNPVIYTVTAEDESIKQYTVIVIQNVTVYVGSDDGNLYALDANTGSLRWKFTTGGPVMSSPTINDGIVYVGSNDQRLYAIDGLNGSLNWTFTTSSPLTSAPTVANGIVYIAGSGFDSYIYAIDESTGILK
jgi:outer membrane protein assembly factor BamB